MKDNFTDRDVLTRTNRPTSDTKGGSTSSTSGGNAGASSSGGGAASYGEGAVKAREGAQEVASKVGETLTQSAEQQKAEGANFVGGIAGAVRRAAREFEGDVPQAAQYIRLAADQLDGVADAVRHRDFNRILSDVQGFARQRPVAFFGAAIFVGFAAMRFFKTSAPASQHLSNEMQSSGSGSSRHWSPPTAMQMPE
jgi:hypothetical protein